jgi:hypothetical protein
MPRAIGPQSNRIVRCYRPKFPRSELRGPCNWRPEDLSHESVTKVIAQLVGRSRHCFASTPASAQQQQKPNIFFIMGDDIGCMQPSIYHQGLMVGETPAAGPSRELPPRPDKGFGWQETAMAGSLCRCSASSLAMRCGRPLRPRLQCRQRQRGANNATKLSSFSGGRGHMHRARV